MANRKMWVIFFFGFILVTGFIYWQGLFIDTEVPDGSTRRNPDVPTIQQNEYPAIIESADIGYSDTPEAQSETDEIDIEFTDEDRQELKEWYKNSVHHQDYAAYNEALLLELADTGDVMAMKTLAIKYHEKGRETTDAFELVQYSQKRQQMVEKAIIYGDREFLGRVPGLSKATSDFTSPNSTSEEKYQGMIDALAYAEFIGLRGDLGEKYYRQMSFFEIYKEWGTPDTLTEQEKQAIRQRAREIYDAYEQKRIELGLGPFDNSVSEGKAKEFEIERQKYLEKMGDKAI